MSQAKRYSQTNKYDFNSFANMVVFVILSDGDQWSESSRFLDEN